MQNFIRGENIKLYRQALGVSTDEEQCKVLRELLRLLILEDVAQTQCPKGFIQPFEQASLIDIPLGAE